jgi:hypothetical protein
VKLLLDDRSLQTGLVRADRIVPIASLARNRDPGASSPTQYLAAQITEATDPRQYRPVDICRALWSGSWCVERPGNGQTGNRHSLAPCRFPLVLAMEVAAAWRPSEGAFRAEAADPEHQHRQPTLGRPQKSTASSSSLASMSGRRRLPSTWLGGGDLRARDGRRFFATMLTAWRRWTSLWSRRSHSGCCTGS